MTFRITLAGVSLALGLLSSGASYASTLSIQLSQAGYDPRIVSTTDGFATFTGSYGTYNFNVTFGTGQPLVPASMGIDFTSNNITSNGQSNTSGPLTLLITQTDLTSADVSSTFRGNIGGTLAGSVTSLDYSTYLSRANTAFGMLAGDLLGSQSFSSAAFSGSVVGSVSGLSLATPFSLTEAIVINAGTGIGQVSFDAQLMPVSPVPLPASAPMFGAALIGLAGLGYAAKRKARVAA